MGAKEDIEGALLDVRKAYRLLHLYQQRVCGLCTEIVETLNQELTKPVEFYHWTASLYGNPPQRGTNLIAGQWSWDFLPLYDFCVFFRPEGQDHQDHNPGDWMFVIRSVADSAGESHFGDSKVEPDPREFASAGESSTLVKLYAYVCLKSSRANWFHTVYGGHSWPEDAEPGEFDEVGIRVLPTTVALSELADKASVQGHVDEYLGDLKKAFPEKTEW